jgi:hypothetical protein
LREWGGGASLRQESVRTRRRIVFAARVLDDARMMLRLACVIALAACGSKTCPPPAMPKVEVVDGESVPPPDDQLKKWQAIHANKDQPPAGTTAAQLVPELVAYLGSVDPVRRDGIAFEVFVGWLLKEPKLSPAEIKELTTKLEANLQGPLDAKDGVYLRSFSALVLSLIVKADLTKPLFDDAERRRLLDAMIAYAGRETDLRGHTGKRGWAHAAAHTSDVLKFLAREPSFTDADRMKILDGTLALITRQHGAIFHHGEDGRIAVAIIEALKGGVPDEAIEPWLKKLAGPLEQPETAEWNPGLYAAQRNARNLLFTLYVQIATGKPPAGDVKLMFDTIVRLLQPG